MAYKALGDPSALLPTLTCPHMLNAILQVPLLAALHKGIKP